MIAEPLTIVDAARRIRAGTLTPSELLEQCLSRIERYEPQVQAWVLVETAGARAEAERLTQEAQRGQFRGTLHGIPIGIKDIFDVAGWPTRAGSRSRADQPPAVEDAAAVAALRAAGAIILGKTVTTDFAGFDPPVTANPWDLARTPGGSSSGSAAAVATGMCLAALGSQTGGSITRPASFCGIASWKPTHGWLNVAGVVPQAPSLDTVGPLAASVPDLILLADVLANATTTFRHAIQPARTRRFVRRIVWFNDGLFAQASPGIGAATVQAVELLHHFWVNVVDGVPLPECFSQVIALHRRVNAAEAAFEHRDWYPARAAEYGPCIAKLIEEGTGVSALDYQIARQGQVSIRDATLKAMSGYDAILTSATVTTAPDRTTTGDSKFNAPWSYTGLPTVSIPCGLADDGLPASLQLVGRPGRDLWLLQIAAQCADALHFTHRPALVK